MATYQPKNLVDAQKFQSKYPETVHAIDPYYWDVVEELFYVRLRSNNEYFWVQIEDINKDTEMITGEVYYELGTNPYSIGDLLIFEKCRMFDVYDAKVFNIAPGLERTQYKRGAGRSYP
jgi:hypothetical protein